MVKSTLKYSRTHKTLVQHNKQQMIFKVVPKCAAYFTYISQLMYHKELMIVNCCHCRVQNIKKSFWMLITSDVLSRPRSSSPDLLSRDQNNAVLILNIVVLVLAL